jgi:short-subunit dehydrogenase
MATLASRLAPPVAALGLAFATREWLRRRHPHQLEGQVVMITGGSRGLGFTLARELAHYGARLAICARNEGPLEQARRELEAMGAEVLAARCDVADRAQVERFVRQTTERFGGVDVLVNNAGIITVGPLQAQTPRDFEESMGVMFWGTLYPTLAVLPQMRTRQRGRIVNITSIGGKVSVPHLLPYNCAKFAAVGFSEGLRAELAKEGIGVITVVPGLMRTGSHVNALFKGQHSAESTWFGLSASLPFTSTSAETAARQIVEALRRNDAEVILTWQAGLLARLQGLFPGLTTELLGLVNRFLPAPDGVGQERRTGRESQTAVLESPLTALGQEAAQDLHQQEREPARRRGGARARPRR